MKHNLTFKTEVQDHKGNNGTIKIHTIKANSDGELVGYLDVHEQNNANIQDYGESNEVLEKSLYISMVKTKPEFENQGIASELYKEFGKLYKEQFDGWEVIHLFSNSIADYLFRKLTAKGDIPKEAYNVKYMFKDDMSDENNENWRSLRSKLPEEYQGSEIDWDYEALYGEE